MARRGLFPEDPTDRAFIRRQLGSLTDPGPIGLGAMETFVVLAPGRVLVSQHVTLEAAEQAVREWNEAQ